MPKPTPASRAHGWFYLGGFMGLLVTTALLSTEYESYASLYDASYTGRETCGDCHTIIYDRWQIGRAHV